MKRSALALTLLGALASLAAGPISGASAQLVREPYLQQGTPTEMTIAWFTDTSEPSSVCVGDTPDALDTRVDGPAGRQHAVHISGLVPARRYYYQIARDEVCPPTLGGDSQRYFWTSPEHGTVVPFRFWVVGDSGTGNSDQAAVVTGMESFAGADRPDIYLHMGDMAYTIGTFDQFTNNFYAPYARILRNTVVWPTIGNHEASTSDSPSESGPYYDGYVLPRAGEAGGMPTGTEAYYSFDYANVHFVVLDSADSPNGAGSAMFTWLEADLSATDQPWIVAYWHHPPYTWGSHFDSESRLRAMRENALPILESHGVDLILAGHSHIYERSYLLHGAYAGDQSVYLSNPGPYIVDSGDGRLAGDGAYRADGSGTVYVVAGHGGTGLSQDGVHSLMYFAELEHGSCLVDVNGGILTLRNVDRFGTETDEFTLVKEDGLYLIEPNGGESYLAGSEVEIRWVTIGLSVSDVRLEHSTDDGESWTEIAASTPNDGSYLWTTPLLRTDRARVRVTDVADAANVVTSAQAFSLTATARTEAIPWGDGWEYNDTDTDLAGTGWRTTTGGWPEGPAQLGYGDGDERTLTRDADPNVPTNYFRQAITVSGEVTRAELSVLFDDGFAVWINDQLVFQRNVDDGLDHATFASAQSDDNEIATTVLDLSSNPFVEGENIIAVAVKQVSVGSSDLSFDLQLVLDSMIDIPGVDPDAGVRDGGRPMGDDAGPPIDSGGANDGGGGRDAGRGGGGGDGCGCRIGAPRPEPAETGHGGREGLAALLGLAGIGLLLRLRGRRRR